MSQSHRLSAERHLVQSTVCHSLGHDRLATLIIQSFLSTHTRSAKASDLAEGIMSCCTLCGDREGPGVVMQRLFATLELLPSSSLPLARYASSMVMRSIRAHDVADRPWLKTIASEMHRAALKCGDVGSARVLESILQSVCLSPSAFTPDHTDEVISVARSHLLQLSSEQRWVSRIVFRSTSF